MTTHAPTDPAAAGAPAQAGAKAPCVDDSGAWLAAGWRDFKAAFGLSFGYGLIFGLVAFVLYWLLDTKEQGALFIPLAGGYLIIAPLLTVGFHEISRRLEMGEKPTVGHMIGRIRHNMSELSMVGLLLMLLFLAWMLAAVLLFAVFFSDGVPWDLMPFLSFIATSPAIGPFLLLGTVVGGIMACLSYAVSAVSMPMIIDKDVSAVDAVTTSVRLVTANWRVMIGWAAMLVVLAGFGMIFFIGLAITLPIAGHASWHAYRGLTCTGRAAA